MLSDPRFLVALAILCVCAVLFGAVMGRRKKPRQPAATSVREIAEGDPDRAFYVRCASARLRYLGDTVPSCVHGALVPMPRAGELLIARVPISSRTFLADFSESLCIQCGNRLFDLYVTGPQTRLDPAHYGYHGASLIARVCGGCGCIHTWNRDEADEVTFYWSVYACDLRAAGNMHAFLDRLHRPQAA